LILLQKKIIKPESFAGAYNDYIHHSQKKEASLLKKPKTDKIKKNQDKNRDLAEELESPSGIYR